MAFEPGNEIWKQRQEHGRGLIFEAPGDLWEAACEYFEWCKSNPLKEDKPFQFQGVLVPSEVVKMRAMTTGGLCLHLGIARNTYELYKSRDDFMPITEAIDATIYDQKFTGAAAGLLNNNIIARELGLKDASELSGPGGGAIDMNWTTTIVKPKD